MKKSINLLVVAMIIGFGFGFSFAEAAKKPTIMEMTRTSLIINDKEYTTLLLGEVKKEVKKSNPSYVVWYRPVSIPGGKDFLEVENFYIAMETIFITQLQSLGYECNMIPVNMNRVFNCRK